MGETSDKVERQNRIGKDYADTRRTLTGDREEWKRLCHSLVET
jgi:hypothetical protein